MTNLYCEPQNYGLIPVKDHDAAGSYEFDMVVIWRRDTGGYVIGHDSGCSCPSPFEAQGVGDLKPVATLADVAAFARESWSGLAYDEHSRAEVEGHVAALVDGLRLDDGGTPP